MSNRTTQCMGCGRTDWNRLSSGLCEVCKPKQHNRLQAENAHLKTLMQDIRNATSNQMERSLVDLREENAKLKEALRAWQLMDSESPDKHPSPCYIMRSQYRKKARLLTDAVIPEE